MAHVSNGEDVKIEHVSNGEDAKWNMSAMARAQNGACQQRRGREMEHVSHGEGAKWRMSAMARAHKLSMPQPMPLE